MTLIKMYFAGSLRTLTADVSRRISEKVGWSLSILGPIVSCSHMYIQDVSQTAQIHVLYTRFRGISAPLSPLLSELEGRANAHPEELSALLAECHSAYFSARKGLLASRLVEEIKGLDPGRTEPIELVSYYLFYYLFLWWFFDMCLSIQSDTIGV
jgi:conserved oligomeric Golgi complex subunit 3